MKNIGARWLLVGVAAAFAFSAAPRSAEACGGEWVPAMMEQVDMRPQGIAMAEKQLTEGKELDAAATVIRVMPHIQSLKAEKSALVARGMRVLALATARGDGSLKVASQVPGYAQNSWLGKTDKERAANLEWSIATLRSLNAAKKDDAATQTDLAEGLAHVDSHRAEAKDMLEKLAKKDLIATPEGYAALAKLRSDAGDGKGEKLALQRCTEMSKGSSVCSAKG
jgi:hypothetical protein